MKAQSKTMRNRAVARCRFVDPLLLAAAVSLVLTAPSWGQVRSSMSDAVRGVTFHSMEISHDAMVDLDVLDGAFSSGDRLTVGLSVMLFEGSEEIANQIVWIRHQGRRWLDYETSSPVALVADGRTVPLEPLRSPQPFISDGGQRFEKMEFLVDTDEFDRVLAADRVTIRLRSKNGDVDKTFSDQELRQVREFLTSLVSPT